MSDDAALLAAIAAAPDEDTPRLAYADWLDEHRPDPAPSPATGPPPGVVKVTMVGTNMGPDNEWAMELREVGIKK